MSLKYFRSGLWRFGLCIQNQHYIGNLQLLQIKQSSSFRFSQLYSKEAFSSSYMLASVGLNWYQLDFHASGAKFWALGGWGVMLCMFYVVWCYFCNKTLWIGQFLSSLQMIYGSLIWIYYIFYIWKCKNNFLHQPYTKISFGDWRKTHQNICLHKLSLK